MADITPSWKIEQLIVSVRGRRVILDADLAALFNVPTKRLNEQVKRNIDRFPPDFMFRLTAPEKAQVVAICDHLKRLKYSSACPYAFTEYGAIMAGNVINSSVAIQSSIVIVRSFVRLREFVGAQKSLSQRLDELENRCDRQFRLAFDALRALAAQPEKPAKRVLGFSPAD